MAVTSVQSIDTTGAEWAVALPQPMDFNGWNQSAVNNYLCELAGLDPAAQDGYVDRPPGPYDAVNCTEARLTPASGATLQFDAGHTLATIYSTVAQTTVTHLDMTTMTETVLSGTY